MRRGPLPMGRTGSSSRGWSLTNWRVLSGRWRELLMFCFRIWLLIHWWRKNTRSIIEYVHIHCMCSITNILLFPEPSLDDSSFVKGTYCSRTWRRSDAVVSDPFGVGLLHCGLLHVLPLGEHLFYSSHVVGTYCWQTHISPGRGWWWRSWEGREVNLKTCIIWQYSTFTPNLQTLTTGRWRPRRWPCPSSQSPSEWRHHELHWRQSWARAWSRPAWLSGRTSTSSAECAAHRGHPVEMVVVWGEAEAQVDFLISLTVLSQQSG